MDCTLRSALDDKGIAIDDPHVIGINVETTDKPAEAKLADLDVYQQGTSTIFGLNLRLSLGDGTTLIGKMDPAVLNGVMFNCVLPTRGWAPEDGYGQGSYGGDSCARGIFQSLVRFPIADWSTTIPFMNLLKSRTYSDSDSVVLSIRLTLDAYINNPENSKYRTGRLIGALGIWHPNEPVATPGHRWLKAITPPDVLGSNSTKPPPWYTPAFYDAPFLVDEQRKRLVIDLSNSIATTAVGGPPVDTGTLSAIQTSSAKVLGRVNYSDFILQNNAGICEMEISDDDLALVQKSAISVVTSRTDLQVTQVLNEDPEGYCLAVDNRVLRIPGSSGSSATTRAHLTQWGRPVVGLPLKLRLYSVTRVDGKLPDGATVPPSNPGNTPQANGAIEGTITSTDSNGFAEIVVKVLRDPGFRTPQLDGQLYFLYPFMGNEPTVTQELRLSVLAWSDYPVNTNATWEQIREMMVPYMKLFPGMKTRLDLTDPTAFQIYACNPPFSAPFYGLPPGYKILDRITGGAIPFFLSCNFNDPRFMPVTRDLSPNKILTILHFIQNTYFPKPTS